MKNGRFIDYSQYSTNQQHIIKKVLNSIHDLMRQINRPVKLMHVCGTHEATVARSGMRSVLPDTLTIIAGPGCPVCVTPSEHVSAAIKLAASGAIITTFGDMFKVPNGKLETLYHAKAQGNDIRIVYSVNEAVEIAKKHTSKTIVWLGVGFETTAPMTSFTLEQLELDNFYVLSDFRLVPPAVDLLLKDPEFDLDGFILPGHVSTITGTDYFAYIPRQYHIPCVVGGFDAVDMLIALEKMLEQIAKDKSELYNAYPRVVTKEGNIQAQESMSRVFSIVDAKWRGIGVIPKSGLALNETYAKYDAYSLLEQNIEDENDLYKGCLCGKVILGQIEPEKCPHFLRRCTPETAIGPCMVSDEGTCRIRATYRDFSIWKNRIEKS